MSLRFFRLSMLTLNCWGLVSCIPLSLHYMSQKKICLPSVKIPNLIPIAIFAINRFDFLEYSKGVKKTSHVTSYRIARRLANNNTGCPQ
jgi:hypothetical protein